MNARELEHLLGEWRQLTEAEGRAISSDNWTEVARQQQRKQDLKLRLLHAREASTDETHAGYEGRLRPIIAQLISLETANAQLLAARRENAQREFAECDRAAVNLRGLNRAYGASTDGHWTSYS
jgi:hypothetical protein